MNKSIYMILYRVKKLDALKFPLIKMLQKCQTQGQVLVLADLQSFRIRHPSKSGSFDDVRGSEVVDRP